MIKPSSSTTARQAAGIALLLIICSEATFEFVTPFLIALNESTRQETINVLKINISAHFKNKQAVDWIISKFQFLCARQISLIHFLENKPEHHEITFKLLEASRVVNLPPDLSQYIMMTSYFFSNLKISGLKASFKILGSCQ